MSATSRLAQALVALFIGGVLVFNYPLLSVFDRVELPFDLPLLYISLFALWALLILVVAWLVEHRR